MKRSALALALLLAAAQTGCAWGYITYFDPELRGREVPHADPYVDPPPPAGVALPAGALSVSCTNTRKFVLLPFPWLRRGFRPYELQLEVAFGGEPRIAIVDLATLGATQDGRPIALKHAEYEGVRPAPTYTETLVLPVGRRVRLVAPRVLRLTFATDAGAGDQLRIALGEIALDGERTLVPSILFEREGQFVSYRTPERKGRLLPEAEGGAELTLD